MKFIYYYQDDVGDYVVVINMRYIIFIGFKWKKKFYCYYIGYLGGFKVFIVRDFYE